MRKRWLVVGLVGCVVLVVTYAFIASWRNIVPTEPLPLRTVTWQEVGVIKGIADLDADGNDELLVQDKRGRWWWAQWSEKAQKREPIPVPAKARLFWFQEVWQDKRPEVLIFVSNQQGIVITRSRNGWEKYVAKKVFKLTRTALTDLDGDGHLNDALLVDGRHLLWLKREPDGRLRQQDRLTLPRPFSVPIHVNQFDGWWYCWAKRYFILENGRLKWSGLKGHHIYWTRADIDGDGQIDQVQWFELSRFKRLKKMGIAQETEVRVWLSKFRQTTSFIVPMSMVFCDPPLVCDMDGDGKAEIVALVPDQHKLIQRLTYWQYDLTKKRWLQKSTQPIRVTFATYGWRRGFTVEKSKEVSLLLLANARQGVAIWRWQLEKGEWKGKELGKLRGAVKRILDTKQNLFVVTEDIRPAWVWWVWERLERWLRLKPPLLPLRLWVHREGKGFQLLVTFPTSQLRDAQVFLTFDLNGDGREELVWRGHLTVYFGDWDGERWRVGKFPLPSADWHGRGRLRNGKKGWLIYQNPATYRCIALTVQ